MPQDIAEMMLNKNLKLIQTIDLFIMDFTVMILYRLFKCYIEIIMEKFMKHNNNVNNICP